MRKKSIVAATLQVSVALFFIKILGVLKQALIAAICGATAETDAYLVATGVTVALLHISLPAFISLPSMHI